MEKEGLMVLEEDQKVTMVMIVGGGNIHCEYPDHMGVHQFR